MTVDIAADLVTVLVLGSSAVYAIMSAARAAWRRPEPRVTTRLARSAVGSVLGVAVAASVGALVVRGTASVSAVQELDRRLERAERASLLFPRIMRRSNTRLTMTAIGLASPGTAAYTQEGSGSTVCRHT